LAGNHDISARNIPRTTRIVDNEAQIWNIIDIDYNSKYNAKSSFKAHLDAK
jgi:hypothetical protein